MENFDYYTVMEARINYFSRKYDPQNKLGNSVSQKRLIKTPSQPEPLESKPVKRRRKVVFDSIVSFFL
jgi:hypothetical protein